MNLVVEVELIIYSQFKRIFRKTSHKEGNILILILYLLRGLAKYTFWEYNFFSDTKIINDDRSANIKIEVNDFFRRRSRHI